MLIHTFKKLEEYIPLYYQGYRSLPHFRFLGFNQNTHTHRYLTGNALQDYRSHLQGLGVR